MKDPGVSVLNGERIKGFVRLELFDKDGNKKVEKDNLIVPGGKTLLFKESASEMLIYGGNVWGLPAKQGAHIMGTMVLSSSPYRGTKKESALNNVLLNLTAEQRAAINEYTNFINMYSDDFGSSDKVVGYAGMELYPAENGKVGVPDFTKGADIVGRTVNSVKYKYKDGVATGEINAIAMAPYSTIEAPYGIDCEYEETAPGFRVAKCLDRVNFYDTNFTSFTTAYTPPGVTGITTDEEIITNYVLNGIGYHKINLATGEVTDLDDANPLYGIINKNSNITDYKVMDDYLYILRHSGGSSSTYYQVQVYKISTGDLLTSIGLSGYYVNTAKFLYLEDILYVTMAGGHQNSNADGKYILHKLEKGSNDYFSSVAEQSNTYAGILTAPSGISEGRICFGHYGDNYIMYVSRRYSGIYSGYCTGYIFTDLTNITGSMIDCIPSLRYSDIAFANASASGVLSIGICSNVYGFYDGFGNSQIISYLDGTSKTQNFAEKGLFYSPDKSWSNIMSVVVLKDDDIIVKESSDVLYVTYGYRIV